MTTISEYMALRPWEFGPIVRLTFSQAQRWDRSYDVIDQILELSLSKSPELFGDQLVLRFEGVSRLRFEQPLLSLCSFGLIELREDGSDFVATEEEGKVSFRFRRFEAHVEAANDL